MEMKQSIERYMVQKVGNFGLKERVLCFNEQEYFTYDLDHQMITNKWSYDEIDTWILHDNGIDFTISTPTHRVKKSVFRSPYRMEVLVCLCRLRDAYEESKKENETQRKEKRMTFSCTEIYAKDMTSVCKLLVQPDGMYQKDKFGDSISFVPYTELDSFDLVVDNKNALVLNHLTQSSVLLLDDPMQVIESIRQIITAYRMHIKDFCVKSMDEVYPLPHTKEISFRFRAWKTSHENEDNETRHEVILGISDTYIIETALNEDEIICRRSLLHIASIIVETESPTAFQIVYVDGVKRSYHSIHRDRLVSGLLASCDALVENQVAVRATCLPGFTHMLPLSVIFPPVSQDWIDYDPSLLAIQSSLLKQIALSGSRKSVKTQPDANDRQQEANHDLALELIGNCQVQGIALQINKPYEAVVVMIIQEIDRIVTRHGPAHPFVCDFLQLLHHIILAPSAMRHFITMMTVNRLRNTIVPILSCEKQPVSQHWLLNIFTRVMLCATSQVNSWKLLLSNTLFMKTLFSLFETHLAAYSMMKLCQLSLLLVKTTDLVKNQQHLAVALYRDLGECDTLLQKILLTTPDLATVEACVGILSRTKVMQNSDLALLAASGEVDTSLVVDNENDTREENLNQDDRMRSIPSLDALLRQYHLLLESPCGYYGHNILNYWSSPVLLRLRYRMRNTFLERLIHKALFTSPWSSISPSSSFTGFLSNDDKQREKCEFKLTPMNIVATNSLTKLTQTFDYQRIQHFELSPAHPNAIAIILNCDDKPDIMLRIIYVDDREHVLSTIYQLGGMIGFQFKKQEVQELPDTVNTSFADKSDRTEKFHSCIFVSVIKQNITSEVYSGDSSVPSERRGYPLNITIVEGYLYEKEHQYSYDLQELRRIVIPTTSEANMAVVLEFNSEIRMKYTFNNGSSYRDQFLGLLFDECSRLSVSCLTILPSKSTFDRKLVVRKIVQSEDERALYLNRQGFLPQAHSELVKEMIRIRSAEDSDIKSCAMKRLLFAMENVLWAVEKEDFEYEYVRELDYSEIASGMVFLLEKTVPNLSENLSEVCLILNVFCRLNNGGYRIMDSSPLGEIQNRTQVRVSEHLAAFLVQLVPILQQNEPLASFWAIETLKSLAINHTIEAKPDMEIGESSTWLEANIRHSVLDAPNCIVILCQQVEQYVSTSYSFVLVSVIYLLENVLGKSRQITSEVQSDALLSTIVSKQLNVMPSLLKIVDEREKYAGIAASVCLLLSVLIGSCGPDAKRRMQDKAIKMGLSLKHLYASFYHPEMHGRKAASFIASLFVNRSHKKSFDMLHNMIPYGFLRIIGSDQKIEKFFNNNELLSGNASSEIKNTEKKVDWFVWRVDKTGALALSSRKRDFQEIYLLSKLLTRPTELPDVIWTTTTRKELKITMKQEIELYEQEKLQKTQSLCWNHVDFSVTYTSLAKEPFVAGLYVRVLLNQMNDVDTFNWHVTPARFFEEVYCRWLQSLYQVDAEAKVESIWMMKMLIGLARKFSVVHKTLSSFGGAGEFVVSLLQNEMKSSTMKTLNLSTTQVIGILELLSFVSQSSENAKVIANQLSAMETLLSFATLGHSNEKLWKFQSASILGEEAAHNMAIFSLESIRNVLVKALKPSKTLDIFPQSTATTFFVNNAERISMLAQLLRVDSDKIRLLVCDILLALGKNAIAQIPHGLYVCLFKRPTEFTDDIQALRMFTPQVEVMQHLVLMDKSYFVDLLPEKMVELLEKDEANSFARVFLGQNNLRFMVKLMQKRNGVIKWSMLMREEFEERISEYLDLWTDKYIDDSAPIAPVRYVEDEYFPQVAIGFGLYLSTLVDMMETINNYDEICDLIEEPLTIMAAIDEKWHVVANSATKRNSGIQNDIPWNNETVFQALQVFGWDSTYSSELEFANQASLRDVRERYHIIYTKGKVDACRAAYTVLCSILEQKDQNKTSLVYRAEKLIPIQNENIIMCFLRAQSQLLSTFPEQCQDFETATIDRLLPLTCTQSNLQVEALEVLFKLLTIAPRTIDIVLKRKSRWNFLLRMIENVGRSTELGTSHKHLAFSIVYVVVSSEDGLKFLSTEADADEHHDTTELESSVFRETTDIAILVDSLLITDLLSVSIELQNFQSKLFDLITVIASNEVRSSIIVCHTKILWKAFHGLLQAANHPKLTKVEQMVYNSSFHALQALAMPNTRGRIALEKLLPFSFFDTLAKPNGLFEFLTSIITDIREPTCLWNTEMREELTDRTANHIHQETTESSGPDEEIAYLAASASYSYKTLEYEPLVGGIYLNVLLERANDEGEDAIQHELFMPNTTVTEFVNDLFVFLSNTANPSQRFYDHTLPALQVLSLLVDRPSMHLNILQALTHSPKDNHDVTLAILGKYLLPFSITDENASISSKAVLSNYGFVDASPTTNQITEQEPQGEVEGIQVELQGSQTVQIDADGQQKKWLESSYLERLTLVLLVLNKVCTFDFSEDPTIDKEHFFAPFCEHTWALQVITDHIEFESSYYAISTLVELCLISDRIAQYVLQSGLYVEILGAAVQSKQFIVREEYLKAEALREPAFEILYALFEAHNKEQAEETYSCLSRFLPYPMMYQINFNPKQAVAFFELNHDKSDFVWNAHWRSEVRRVVDQVICRNRQERSEECRNSIVFLDGENAEMDIVRFPGQEANFQAGLYLDKFLSNPDVENLTNPAYNLHLLFQLWRNEWSKLLDKMAGAQNPLQLNLKDTAMEIDNLTAAIIHILRCESVQIHEAIEKSIDMPAIIVTMLKYCNQNYITNFPYRCVLRIARRLVEFAAISNSKEFLEYTFCRLTTYHADSNILLKILRQLLEFKAENLEQLFDFRVHKLECYKEMMTFLEQYSGGNIAELHPNTDKYNACRIFELLQSEEARWPTEEALKAAQRAGTRWYSFTLRRKQPVEQQEPEPDTEVESLDSPGDNDLENSKSFYESEREKQMAKVLSTISFDGVQVVSQDELPRTFGYTGGKRNVFITMTDLVGSQNSNVRALYEPKNSYYHTTKVTEVLNSKKKKLLQQSLRVPLNGDAKRILGNDSDNEGENLSTVSDIASIHPDTKDETQSTDDVESLGNPMAILDSWRKSTDDMSTSKSITSLSSFTISRRQSRSASVYSRRDSRASKEGIKN